MEVEVEMLIGQTSKVTASGKVVTSVPVKEGGPYETTLAFTAISETDKERLNVLYYTLGRRAGP